MTSELMSLSLVLALHLVMWVPYVVNTIAVRGLTDALGYPDNPSRIAPWAERMKAAHYNSVENLVVFSALVFIVNTAAISNDVTVLACQMYFWARLGHALFYTFAIPVARTLAFAMSWLCQVALLMQII